MLEVRGSRRHCLLWIFMGKSFPDSEKYMKQIKKCSRCDDYERIMDGLFRDLEFRPL